MPLMTCHLLNVFTLRVGEGGFVYPEAMWHSTKCTGKHQVSCIAIIYITVPETSYQLSQNWHILKTLNTDILEYHYWGHILMTITALPPVHYLINYNYLKLASLLLVI